MNPTLPFSVTDPTRVINNVTGQTAAQAASGLPATGGAPVVANAGTANNVSNQGKPGYDVFGNPVSGTPLPGGGAASIATKYNINQSAPSYIGTSDPTRQNEQNITQTTNNLSQNNVSQPFDLNASLAGLQSANDSANNILTARQKALADQEAASEANINSQYDQKFSALNTSQANETGSTSAQLARMGGYLGGSASQMGVLANLNHSHQMEMAQLQSQKDAAIQAAKNAVAGQNFDLAKQMNDNAAALQKNIQDRKDAFFTQSQALIKSGLDQQSNQNATIKAQQDQMDAVAKNIAPIIFSQFKNNLNTPDAQSFIQNTAKEYGIDANQLAGHVQDYSNTQNLNQLKLATPQMKDFNYAVSNAGYQGSFTDYQNFMANLKAKSTAFSQAVDNLGDISSYAQNTVSNKPFIDGTQFTGTEKQAAMAEANQLGIPFLDATSKESVDAIDTVRLNTQSIGSYISDILPKDASGRVVAGPSNLLSQFIQSDDQKSAYGTFQLTAINDIKALAGTKGMRITQAEINNAINNDVPKITDTLGTAQQKLKNLNGLLNNKENLIMTKNRSSLTGADLKNGGSVAPAGSTKATGPDGKTYNVPNDKLDAFIKAGGKKI